MLAGKHIVLGITGSIAAYKACLLVRSLVKEGAEVQAVITPAGKEFITPVTLSALTGRPVVSEFFAHTDGTWHSHVDLGQWADAMLVAPATASTIGKMANGIADNMLVTTYLSMKAPVFVAPAMDLDMYAHPSTQHNLETLRSRGNVVIEPATGELASHLEGKGRMQEPHIIIEALRDHFTPKDLAGRTVLVTAGPTYERLDPVRFIGNFSSGKMGLALADECARRGAKVELLCGPVRSKRTLHPNIHRTDVESTQEMYDAATSLFPTADAAILCAAVCDFAPDNVAEQKLKHTEGGITLTLKPTADIAAALGKTKRDDQRLVGFALETNNETANAREKLKNKRLDFIVLNSLRDEGAGFQCDTNRVTIIAPDGEEIFPLKPKTEVAHDIVDRLKSILP